MNQRFVVEELARMVAGSKVEGLALVDAGAGLVWHASGELARTEGLSEAAVDYWRLHDRQHRHFASLGPLGAAVMYHQHGVLAVLPCCQDPQLLIVAQAPHSGVDWIDLQRQARALGQRLAAA